MPLNPPTSGITGLAEDRQPVRHDAPPVPPEAPLQFSIETLLLITTLIAVCLGVGVAALPLGFLAFFLAAGALIRTLLVAKHFQQQGKPFPIGEKIAAFIISCGVVITAVVLGCLVLVVLLFIGGFAVMLLTEAVDPRSNSASAIVSIFGGFYFLLAMWAPILTIVWFFWATRPSAGSEKAN